MEYLLNPHNEIIFNFSTTTVNEKGETIIQPVNEGTYGVIMIGLVAILDRNSIIDSTEFLFKQEFKTDSDGLITVNLEKTLQLAEAIRFYRNYYEKYSVALKTTIELPKNENYDYLILSDNISAEWVRDAKTPQFKSIIYPDYNDIIYMNPVGSSVTNFVQLRAQYKTAEENYLLIKKRYESEVISNIVDVELPINDTYEPSNFTQVITRLLEFQTGTLVPGISHAKKLNLENEYKKLDTLNKMISNVTRMYPKITINDGEGIPYNKELVSEATKSMASE